MESPTSLLSAPLTHAGVISAWRGSASRYVALCSHAFVVKCAASLKPLHEQHVFWHLGVSTFVKEQSGVVMKIGETAANIICGVFIRYFLVTFLGLMLLFCAFQLLILIPWIMWKQCGIRKSSTSVLAHLSSWWAASWIFAMRISRLLTEPDGLWQGKV